jgi:hypothetical protein
VRPVEFFLGVGEFRPGPFEGELRVCDTLGHFGEDAVAARAQGQALVRPRRQLRHRLQQIAPQCGCCRGGIRPAGRLDVDEKAGRLARKLVDAGLSINEPDPVTGCESPTWSCRRGPASTIPTIMPAGSPPCASPATLPGDSAGSGCARAPPTAAPRTRSIYQATPADFLQRPLPPLPRKGDQDERHLRRLVACRRGVCGWAC